jgi:hypothetical protein
MLAYCFVSHNSVVIQDYVRIKNMMKSLEYDNYFIFYGGELHTINDHIIHLDCDDSYAGLPDKMNRIYKYLSKQKNIKFVLKIDRTANINRIIELDQLKNIDYGGGRIWKFGCQTYHFNKCEKTSKWYNKPFIGDNIEFCSGVGYILSKKSVEIIASDENYDNHIYEDYYVAHTLLSHGILPQHIPMKEYVYDSDHPKNFQK